MVGGTRRYGHDELRMEADGGVEGCGGGGVGGG